VTSLDGPGFSITVLDVDEQLTKLLDALTSASAWPRSILACPPSDSNSEPSSTVNELQSTAGQERGAGVTDS
jgi:dihydroxyacetone kinase